MNKILALCIVSFSFVTISYAQSNEKLNIIEKYGLNNGNKAYKANKIEDAEKAYNNTLSKKPNNSLGLYNLGHLMQHTGKTEEARKLYEAAVENSNDKLLKAKALHNLGNSYMKEEKWEDAVKYLKKSLKANPNDEDTRYNLAYANEMLRKQNEQNKDNKDQNQDNKDQKKDNKDQDQQDQDQNKDQQDQDKEEEKRQQQQQQQPKRMSKEEAERNLKALRDKEKKLHQQKNDKQGEAYRYKNEKDW